MRLAFLLALLLGGCSLTSGPGLERDESAPIQTDRLAYTAQNQGRTQLPQGSVTHYAFDVVARFTNPTADTVYLYRDLPSRPHPTYGVSSVGEGAREGSAYNGIVQPVQHDHHIAVAPGSVRVDTLRIWGPAVWDVTGEYDGELAGQMRVEYEVERCGEPCPWEGARLVSNEFLVRLR